MARSPLPIIRKPSDENVQMVVSQTSQEELELRHETEERRHDENLEAQKKISDASEKLLKEQEKEAERKRREEAKKEREAKRAEREFLKEQSRMFDKSMRTGLFGSLEYIVRNFDDVQKNLAEAISDSTKSFFFGKTVEDRLRENEGDIRTSMYERLLTGEKYKEAPSLERDKSEEDDYEEDQEESPDDKTTDGIEAGTFSADEANFSNVTFDVDPIEDAPKVLEKAEESSSPMFEVVRDGEFPTKVDVGYDETALELEIPLLEKIEKSVSGLFKSFVQFRKAEDQRAKDLERSKNVEDLTSRVTSDSPVEIPKEVGSRFGPFLLGSAGAIMGAISGVVTAAVGTVTSLIARAAPIAALAAGLYLAVKDGISGWFSAEAWGVSNISGLAGGLIGGMGEGMMNSFANAGKWALIGAGIGSVFGGPLGILLGGAIGGAFGGLMGYFGGERIAKFVDGIGTFIWDSMTTIATNIKEYVKEMPGRVITAVERTWESIVDTFNEVVDSVGSYLTKLKEDAKNYVKNLFTLDYWLGGDQKVLDGETRFGETPVEVERPKIKVEVEPGGLSSLSGSLEKYIENLESGPEAQRRDSRTENLYEGAIDNSVTNQTTSDFSRTTNQSVISGSYNKANINLMSTPSVRNQEGSAFGTQSLLNHGFGNFSRR